MNTERENVVSSQARPKLTMGFQKLAKTSPGFVGSTALLRWWAGGGKD